LPCRGANDLRRNALRDYSSANYCLRALVERGWIKVANFKNSENRTAYLYLLTPRGIEAKANLTLRFLQRKMREYETLRVEIEQLRRETEGRDPQ
jgi:EPS-associated MarR family transcriptional regulator